MMIRHVAAAQDKGLTDYRVPRPGRCDPVVPSRNRRTCERAEGDTAVIFSVNGSGLFHRGKIINHSENGLCFASFYCMPPGTEIRVKTRDRHTNCFETGQRWHIARVVWVRQVNTEDGCFQTGICFAGNTR